MKLTLCLLVSAVAIWAQTPAAAPALNAFSEESVIAPNAIDSVTAANISPDVLAAVQGGAQELHQTINYLPATNALQITGFVEPVGSPLPTPPSASPVPTLWSYTVSLTNTLFGSQPKTTITFTGTVSASAGAAFGNLIGSEVIVSAAYAPAAAGASSTTPSTQFSGVATNVVGSAVLFAGSGTGSLQSTMPGGALTAVAGPKGMQTSSPTFQLNATQSSDPAGSKLTYMWAFLPVGGQTVQFDDPTLATPTITFPQNDPFAFGDYTFQLTVTNASGGSATDTVTVTYTSGN